MTTATKKQEQIAKIKQGMQKIYAFIKDIADESDCGLVPCSECPMQLKQSINHSTCYINVIQRLHELLETTP